MRFLKLRKRETFSKALKEKYMLKITKDEYLNDEKIECIAIYGSVPLQVQVRMAKEREQYRGFVKKGGLKSVIFLDDGFIFHCPYMPNTYLSRMNEEDYMLADPLRYLLKKKKIRDISTNLTALQRRLLKEAKKNGSFINLARSKAVKYYVFMESGRIYGLHTIKNM